MDNRLSLSISHVTVHPGQARIERSGPLPPLLPSGWLLLSDLPLIVLESSVQVRIEGAPFEVAELTVGWDLEAPDAGSAPELERQLLDARDALTRLMSRLSEVEQRIAFWNALAPDPLDTKRLPFAGPEAWSDSLVTRDFWGSTLETMENGLDQAQAEYRALQEEIREASRQVERAQDALNRASSTELSGPMRRHVRLRLVEQTEEPPAQGQGRIILSYLVPGATWLPSYQVRLSPDGQTAELAVRALVAQRTGEDWAGVRLSLSTADGRYTTELPTLPALRIGRAQPSVPRTGWRPPPEGLEALFAGYDQNRPGLPFAPISAALPPSTMASISEMIDEELEDVGESGAAYNTGSNFPAYAPDRDRGGYGGAPPPPPGAAPSYDLDELAAPSMSMPSGSMSMPAPEKSRSRMSSLPARRQAPEPKMKKEAASMEFGRGGARPGAAQGSIALGSMPMASGGGGAAKPLPPPSGMEVATDLLHFDSLRLGGPGEHRRGELRPLSTAESLAERLSQGSHVKQVLSALQYAEREARRVTSLEMPVHSQPVTQSRGRFDHRYDAALPVDLPSDGRFHALTLVRAGGPARLLHRTVPRIEPVVYRELVLTNPLSAPLLAGPADLYLGADLVATSPLETVAAGGTLRLGMGVEERLKVARNTRYKEVAAGLLSGSLSLEHEIVIALTSQLDRPAELEVLERLPVSEEHDIEVKEGASEPRAMAYDQVERGQPVRGGRRFQLTIAPRGEVQCKLAYRVMISAKQELIDGNRRD